MGSGRDLLSHPAAFLRAEVTTRALARQGLGRLLVHREASPIGRGRTEQRLLRRAELAVYDFDDALQHDLGHGRAAALFPKARKVLAACGAADRVLAGNDYLADYAAQWCDDVRVIPSCVRPQAYSPKTNFVIADPPRVVWVGSRSTERELAAIADALLELNRRTGARLLVIGYAHGDLGPLEDIIDRRAWVEGGPERWLAEGDLGIMPLLDIPYNRGKCGYKLLQYAAAALPMVASPVGVNTKILASTAMACATSDDEWLDAMQALIALSSDSREACGRKAREVIERQFSFDAWESRWMSAVGATE